MSAAQQRFEGQGAIVVGGASGVGRVVAKRITDEGGRVSIWDFNADALKGVKAETGATHGVALDITDPEALIAAAASVGTAFGRIDVLVVSAGIIGATAP